MMFSLRLGSSTPLIDGVHSLCIPALYKSVRLQRLRSIGSAWRARHIGIVPRATLAPLPQRGAMWSGGLALGACSPGAIFLLAARRSLSAALVLMPASARAAALNFPSLGMSFVPPRSPPLVVPGHSPREPRANPWLSVFMVLKKSNGATAALGVVDADRRQHFPRSRGGGSMVLRTALQR